MSNYIIIGVLLAGLIRYYTLPICWIVRVEDKGEIFYTIKRKTKWFSLFYDYDISSYAPFPGYWQKYIGKYSNTWVSFKDCEKWKEINNNLLDLVNNINKGTKQTKIKL